MLLTTPLTDRLGITHPVLLAPMAGVAGGALAAAVSRAGGLGFLGGGYGEADWLERELGLLEGTRFGIGFITWSLARRPALLERALAARPTAVMLAFGDIRPFVEPIRAAGAVLICQIQTVKQAREVAALGADILVAQGTEAGGHAGARATLPLVPEVVDAVAPLPVVAAGGIADGRGLAAALMLGASGVLVGTRFYAAEEALADPRAKERLVAADGDATLRGPIFDIARGRDWPAPWNLRTLENTFARRWRENPAGLRTRAARARAEVEAARAAGDFDIAPVIAGEAAGLVRKLCPAAEIVDTMVAEAAALLADAAGHLRPVPPLSEDARDVARDLRGF